MNKTALITGASSGFGLRTSVTLARRGWRVLATMRDLGRREKLETAARDAGVLERIEFHSLDITNPGQIAAITALVASRSEPLHALVNNAGFGIAGFAEDVTDAELRNQFDTNFFGTAAVTRALLPQLRRQGFGHVVIVSSIAGLIGTPGLSSYSASKFALEGWTEALRLEVKRLGVQVVLVEPGQFKTDIWTRNGKFSAGALDPNSPNAVRFDRMRKRIEKESAKRPDPQVVADAIVRILENPHPKLRYVVGRNAQIALLVRSLLPAGMFERMIVKLSRMDESPGPIRSETSSSESGRDT